MPKPRFSGGSVSIRISSRWIVPPESGSSPAMQLSAVDLPQPEGPSSAMNSPRRTVIVSSLSALNALPPAPAKRRVTRSSRKFTKVFDSSWKRPRPCGARRDEPSFHFVFCAPTCWSQIRNASTCALGGSDCVCGNSFSQPSYSGRPYSLIASCASFGAIDSDTFFTAGPG